MTLGRPREGLSTLLAKATCWDSGRRGRVHRGHGVGGGLGPGCGPARQPVDLSDLVVLIAMGIALLRAGARSGGRR
jgi:hypothetical protein